VPVTSSAMRQRPHRRLLYLPVGIVEAGQ